MIEVSVERTLFDTFRQNIDTEFGFLTKSKKPLPLENSKTVESFDELFYYLLANSGLFSYSSIEISLDVPTACIHLEERHVQIGLTFLYTLIKNVEDLKFILAHEDGHKAIGLFMSTCNFSERITELYLLDYKFKNFLEDALINLTLIHAIKSKLPEKFYTSYEDMTILLQRNIKFWRPLLNKSKPEAKRYLLECANSLQDYINSSELENLYEYLKNLVEYLIIERPDTSKYDQHLVDHDANVNSVDEMQDGIVGGFDQPMDVGEGGDEDQNKQVKKSGSSKYGSLNNPDSPITLYIPITGDVDAASVHKILPSLKEFTSSVLILEEKLFEAFSNKMHRAESGFLMTDFSYPSPTDVIKLHSNIVTPWVKSYHNKPPVRVAMIDVSGSMIKYLRAATRVLNKFITDVDAVFGFSTLISNIIMERGYYKIQSGAGTKLSAILQYMNDNYDSGEVYLITDAQFAHEDWEFNKDLRNLMIDSCAKFKFYILKVIDCVEHIPDSFDCQVILLE